MSKGSEGGEGGEAPRARVDRVIAAARRIADPGDPLGVEARRRLPATSGLSPEGVALALGEHLEAHPGEDELRALIAGAGRARRCQVVLAANVCTAALRAVAVAAATARVVRVRPSRRDPVVAELLARALDEDRSSPWRFELTAELDLPGEPGDELHVYGADETVAALAAQAGPGVIVRGHGTGIGVAVIGAGADVTAAARAVAADVIPFDQRGCLSPRMVLVEGPPARAEALARALHEALASAGERVPRGPLDDAARAEIALHRAMLEAIGAWWEGPGHGVGLDPAPRSLALPPAARIAHVVPASAASIEGPANAGSRPGSIEGPANAESRPGSIEGLLAPWARVIAALGEDGGGPLIDAARRMLPRARRSPLGWMQRPALDGPVDLRPR